MRRVSNFRARSGPPRDEDGPGPSTREDRGRGASGAGDQVAAKVKRTPREKNAISRTAGAHPDFCGLAGGGEGSSSECGPLVASDDSTDSSTGKYEHRQNGNPPHRTWEHWFGIGISRSASSILSVRPLLEAQASQPFPGAEILTCWNPCALSSSSSALAAASGPRGMVWLLDPKNRNHTKPSPPKAEIIGREQPYPLVITKARYYRTHPTLRPP